MSASDPIWPAAFMERQVAVRAAVIAYRAQDPTLWQTGLSEEGARRALTIACDLVLDGLDEVEPLEDAPNRLVIWCAGNVFTAALEWTALFALLGSEVLLKAPSASPASTLALAACFEALGARAVSLPHALAFPLLEGADAVLGFGSDGAMAELERRLPEEAARSLHGHRLSAAIVRGDHAELAHALALDAALYDGRGCMSPAAVFTLGDAEALAQGLYDALADLDVSLPRGELSAGLGPLWRRRTGLARVLGRCLEGPRWAVPILPLAHFEPGPPPRMLPVHGIRSLDELSMLRDLPLSSCAIEGVEPRAVEALGFVRVCRPGELQMPALGRHHDGVDVLGLLCRRSS